MEFKIKKLEVKNFKNIINLKINFEDETFIEGANRSGKSSVFDAFIWLLFGKDSSGKQEFKIKPLDGDNKTKPKIEIEVFGIFMVNDKKLTIKRTLRENWIKPRGQLETVLKGNNTFFEWNSNDISSSEFEKRRNNLMHEKIFKLVTSPLYFNSIDWKLRRKMLIDLISKDNIVLPDSEFSKFSDTEIDEKIQSVELDEFIKELQNTKAAIEVYFDIGI